MRRKERERDEQFALEVIDRAPYGVMGLIDREGLPYTVALYLVRDPAAEDVTRIYFHGAKAGKKIEAFDEGQIVSLSFVSFAKAPKLFSRDEVKAMVETDTSGELASKVYTIEYKSAHTMGRLYTVEAPAEKARALQLTCDRFTPDMADLAPAVIDNSLKYTGVYRIDLSELHGKEKKVEIGN